MALCSETLATLGSAALDHLASTRRLHLNEKAVRLGALLLFGLVGPFHVVWLLLKIDKPFALGRERIVVPSLLTCLCPFHKF